MPLVWGEMLVVATSSSHPPTKNSKSKFQAVTSRAYPAKMHDTLVVVDALLTIVDLMTLIPCLSAAMTTNPLHGVLRQSSTSLRKDKATSSAQS
jgi:hypothetical protein